MNDGFFDNLQESMRRAEERNEQKAMDQAENPYEVTVIRESAVVIKNL